MTETSSTADIEDKITRACRTIAAMWPAMLPTGASIGVGRTSAKALITRPDDSDDTDDLPRIDVLVDLRRDVTITLNGWVRVTIEDQGLTKAIPHGDDVPGMCQFLTRWARWWSGHEAADVIADELTTAAHDCAAATFPRKRTRTRIGACTWCGADVWAKPGDLEITCRACGCTGGVGEWADALGDLEPVTLPQLAKMLHRRMGMKVTDRTLRRWHVDGILTQHIPFGPQPEFPSRWPVFDPLLAMRAISTLHRPCPLCGMPWAGSGWECLRCRAAQPSKPTKAQPRPSPPPRPREQQPTILLDPEQEAYLRAHRCEETGLPLAWCACGWCEAC